MFREGALPAGLGAQLIFWTGQASYFLVFALSLKFGCGLAPLDAGLIFVAIGAGYMATSTTARFVAARLGRQVIALGGLLRIVGLSFMILTLALIGDGGNIGWLVPALVIDGAGQGLAGAAPATPGPSPPPPPPARGAARALPPRIQARDAPGLRTVG